MKPEYLLSCGFTLAGKEDGYEYTIKQYGGYSDYIFINIKDKRLFINYKMNSIELQNCNVRKINVALRLVGLPILKDLNQLNP